MANRNFDSEAAIRDARLKGFTTERILREFGVQPAKNGSWKGFDCPFCQKKKANLFPHDGIMLFKCMMQPCPSNNEAMAEPKLVARLSNVSERQGFIDYLKMAGVWKDISKVPRAVELPKKPTPEQGDKAPLPNAVLPAEIKLLEAPPPPAPPRPDDLLKLLDDPDPIVFLSVSEKIMSFGPVALDWLRPALTQEASTPADIARRSRINELIQKLTPPPAPPAAEKPPVEKPKDEPPKPVDVKKLPNYGSGRLALREFYECLVWLEDDEKKLFEKRGLESRTSVALGFRSNPKTNEDNIRRLLEKWGFREMIGSGLWLPRDAARKKETRPNNQFFGFGQAGRKPADQRKNKDDKFIWKFCHPILIPYFNDLGELVALRPHKGGAPGGTAAGHSTHIYVPRDVEAMGGEQAEKYAEIFETVIITEGEFKAAALWQMVGAGRQDGGEAYGVAAVPGITFANNFMMREELDHWLRAVRCRRVIVAYDHELKDDPKSERYQPDVRKRHDAQIWSRYLATDLHQKLHITGEVCILPNQWMTDGKADWDGALVKLISETK